MVSTEQGAKRLNNVMEVIYSEISPSESHMMSSYMKVESALANLMIQLVRSRGKLRENEGEGESNIVTESGTLLFRDSPLAYCVSRAQRF